MRLNEEEQEMVAMWRVELLAPEECNVFDQQIGGKSTSSGIPMSRQFANLNAGGDAGKML